MKLRKKETGEIGYFCFANWNDPVLIIMDKDGVQLAKYNSLAEMNAEWEDAPEEPKEYWYISDFGYVFNHEINNKSVKSTIEEMKSIGNYFLSREEAEKAVGKLKAWKRLKDKGFSIYSWDYEFVMVDKPSQTIILRASAVDTSNTDLDLLFSGEDD